MVGEEVAVPLDPAEALALAPRAARLGSELRDLALALQAARDDGEISPEERREISRRALALVRDAAALGLDLARDLAD